MLDLISEEELNKQRSYKDIDKDPKKFKELIEDKFLNQGELAEYYNCSTNTIDKRIRKYDVDYKRKTTKQFRYEVEQLVGDEYSVLGEYVSASTKIKMKHNECGYIYKIAPNNFLIGNRCPLCNLASTPEIKIYDYLNNSFNNFKYNYGDHNCINEQRLLFDFFIDDINTVIEYDGRQHFNNYIDFYGDDLEYMRKHDKIKNQYCIENDIRLIRIPYWRKDCIEEILESIFINDTFEQEWTLNEYWAENKEIDYLVVS